MDLGGIIAKIELEPLSQMQGFAGGVEVHGALLDPQTLNLKSLRPKLEPSLSPKL